MDGTLFISLLVKVNKQICKRIKEEEMIRLYLCATFLQNS